MAMPRAPDCDDMATLPGGGNRGPNCPFRLTAGSVFSTPMQLGPTIRMPPDLTTSSSSLSRASPAVPVSENPAVIITMPLTPASVHCCTVSIAKRAGTTTNARSTGAPISATDV